MSIDMSMLFVGNTYTRDDLSKYWGYKGRQALSRGIFTPKNDQKIILFVTKIKQKSDTQYNDYFMSEGLLHLEGELKSSNDKRLIFSSLNNDEIYLFYREIHHTPFIYHGPVSLVRYEVRENQPSIFIFSTFFNMKNLAVTSEMNFFADSEGAKKFIIHVSYERSVRNRIEALKFHGTTCKVCGFDFNKMYGEELAKNFIEVHHVKPLNELDSETKLDPYVDLVPLCANCHRMIHHQKNRTLSIKDLKEIIKTNKNL